MLEVQSTVEVKEEPKISLQGQEAPQCVNGLGSYDWWEVVDRHRMQGAREQSVRELFTPHGR